ncbi:DNA-binding transcriptional LysR family regulator [Sphingomonas vulcanisoli]|uniref:DNA-binding transcriptional LysR family regulator n=1 Tax=Sphingomonas vulcanisoli TaxID=1658060 RepID=A0ABX0TPM3_9SPHN|nr:LysR family transcriptional regulator [Sphingomonas vulcanisoli]NIJ06575.1 DNA-binding transcriptional LysR family regulator [Sphingomonas vulcanisoli]
MSLRSINQNLLPVLLALLRERNVTVAARSLGLTQPAVSKSLIQLRAILGDELLVRSGRGLALTKRGEELLDPVAQICESLDQLWQARIFDPAKSRRQFIIAGTDYCPMLLVPALVDTLRAQAPGVSMRFVDLVPDALMDDRADIDFAMTPDFMLSQQLRDATGIMRLFDDDFVAVVAKGHPLSADGASPPKDMSDTPSILFGNNDPLLPKDLRGTMPLTVPSPTLAVVQQLTTLPLLALMTGTVAIVPRRLIDLLIPTLPLHIIEGIVPEREVTVVLAWHKRRDGDADHRWFRDLIATHLGDTSLG